MGCHENRLCHGNSRHSRTFNIFNRILIEGTDADLDDRPGSVSVVEKSRMACSRVSRVKKILTDIRTCGL